MREGLHENLTVVRLGLTGALQRTLRSTNAIENLNSSVQRYTRNVKRWRGGEMIQRWVSAALLDAEGRFRRVRGFSISNTMAAPSTWEAGRRALASTRRCSLLRSTGSTHCRATTRAR